MKAVEIFTDGGCAGNPGPGAWAAVLRHGQNKRELSGGVPATTNNRMELQAAIEALRSLKEPCAVELHTDSQYLREGITAWLPNWKRRRWKTLEGKPVKNVDLWKSLDELVSQHQIKWRWVKGHAGVPDNERCDELAQAAITHLRKQYTPQQLAAAVEEFKTGRNQNPNQVELGF